MIRQYISIFGNSRLAKIILFGLIIIGALLLSGASYQTVASASERQRYLPPGKLIELNGSRFHLYCSGAKQDFQPTAILEGGLGAPSFMWTLVQTELAKKMRVCSYDRAGYGWSDPDLEQRRTAHQIETELHSLLEAAEESPPYLLVGHSFGGLLVRAYTNLYPNEVAGVILVDARHENFFERMPAAYLQTDQNNLYRAQIFKLITPFGVTRLVGASGYLESFESYLKPLPDDIRAIAWALMVYNPQHWSTAVAEREAIEESYSEVEDSLLPVGLPLIVLTAEDGLNAWRSDESPIDAHTQAIWLNLQQELANLSTNSQWIVVANCGHYIHLEQPKIIIEAVLSLVKNKLNLPLVWDQ